MQDIILLGAEYEDVPAVNLPAVGGGTAKFTDASVVTATPSDVASGKVFVDSNGDEQIGTASGGSAVIEALSVTANGTYTAPSGVDGYSPVTVNVSGGGGAVSESDVNFYDYDGALVASHTKAEINAMSSDSDLPANPSHTGLTAQGWNWTLAQIKTQLTAMPDQPVSVGQMYVTDDDKTRIYVHFEKGRTSPYLGICPNGTVTINWGDGSSTSTLTGTSLTTVKRVQHVWPDVTADYMITLEAASGTTFAFYGSSSYGAILNAAASSSTKNYIYLAAVKKVETGSAAIINAYSFLHCVSMETVTLHKNARGTSTALDIYTFKNCDSLKWVNLPSTIEQIGGYCFTHCSSLRGIASQPVNLSTSGNIFQNCYSLRRILLRSGATVIPTYSFQNCYSLEKVFLPSSITTLGTYAFHTCTSLRELSGFAGVSAIPTYAFYQLQSLAVLTIPSSVTSIAANSCGRLYGLSELHFESSTPPTMANSNAWSNLPTDCKIYVPSGSLSAYTSATNYPSSSTYTYIEE